MQDQPTTADYYFNALHEARSLMSRLGFLSNQVITISSADQRKLYEIIDNGMNPPPKK